ncbi:MAG: pilus assembly protein PilM [Candidatus Omnitrophica bacterium]|nr:pilus assembly protein PilM [Candidatus Omnitrophota bacterium]
MKRFFRKEDPETEKLKLRQRLSYGPSIVGIDISSSSVNLAQMAYFKGKLTLIRTRIVNIIKKSEESDEAATMRALNIALEDFNRRNIKYVCVVNCPQTCVRKIVTPSMPPEDLRGAVSLEVKRSIPFALSDAILDYDVIEKIDKGGVEKWNIVVAASPKAAIEKILSYFTPKKSKPFSGSINKNFEAKDTIEPLDIKISALLPLSLCLENVIKKSKLKIDETLVTIEMGTVVTELNIYMNAKLQFSRKIPFSGQQITKSLTGALMTDRGKVELTLEEAERVKKEYGIPDIKENKMVDGKITTNQILSLIRPKVEQLAREIERSFDFYQEEMHGGKVDRVVLFGGGAQLKGLPEFLSKELGMEVSVGNPLVDIELISNDIVECEADAHKLVLAIGAALSGMKGINLLPKKVKDNKKDVYTKSNVLQKVGVVLAALMGITLIPLLLRVHHFQNEYAKAKQDLNGLVPELKAIEEGLLLNQIASAKNYWDESLKEISNVVSSDMYLEGIQVKENVFNIRGVIDNSNRSGDTLLSKFMLDLEKGVFKNVKLVRTEKKTFGVENITFEVTCKLE